MKEQQKIKLVAKRIQAARNVSQEKAAELTHTSYRVYQRIEGAERAPDLDFLITFCKVFDTKLKDILQDII